MVGQHFHNVAVTYSGSSAFSDYEEVGGARGMGVAAGGARQATDAYRLTGPSGRCNRRSASNDPSMGVSTVESRVDPAAEVPALVAALTIEEKIALLHQHQPAIERLG